MHYIPLAPAEHHSFSVDEAIRYGIEKALIINNLRYWLRKNKANDQNHKFGYYWTYNSTKAFAKLFPYMNEKSISRWLNELEKDEIILSGNFNRMKTDRTKWFTLREPEFCTIPQNEKSKMSISDLGQKSQSLESPVFSGVMDNLEAMTTEKTATPHFEGTFSQNEEPLPDTIPSIIDSFSISPNIIIRESQIAENQEVDHEEPDNEGFTHMSINNTNLKKLGLVIETPNGSDLSEDKPPIHTKTPEEQADEILDNRRMVLNLNNTSYASFRNGLIQAFRSDFPHAMSQFIARNRSAINFRLCTSSKGEEPIDHEMITREYLSKIPITKPMTPMKVYVGQDTIHTEYTPVHDYAGKMKMVDCYIYLYNLEWLEKPKNIQMVRNLHKRGEFVASYHSILENIIRNYKPKNDD
jgi:hypothetical protein